MNISSLKPLAPAVRRQLMKAVERKLDYPKFEGAVAKVARLRK